MLFKTDNLSVRYLQQKDQHLLVKWLSIPSVLEFYEGRDSPFNLAKVTRKFYNQEDGVDRCIVNFDGLDIGYIQFYLVNDKTSVIDDYNEGKVTYGMDQFIGETKYWNKGIGTLMISAMVNYLIQEKKVDRVVMDPQITNERALKCYEKCGFKKVRLLPKHEFHEGTYRDCWLMEYKKIV